MLGQDLDRIRERRRLGDLGRRKEQLEALQRVVELAPHDPENWSQLGLAGLDVGDLAAAEAAFRQALQRAPRNADEVAANPLGLLIADFSWSRER
ncbi:MAG: hypothetical protein HC927_00910 [Deltaproteobacteria bacterium]|nr:hypothetical protein [Deltaproteobacteria bacterium]